MAFFCRDCKKEHEGLPDLGMDAPDAFMALSPEEREERAVFGADRCVIHYDDGESDFFIRGVAYIPVHGQKEPFGIGLWVTQSEKNFERYLDEEEDMEPTFGWLANRLGFYEQDSLALKTRVHFQGGRLRPKIELEPTDHPFSVDQREGITLEKAWKIVHRYMD